MCIGEINNIDNSNNVDNIEGVDDIDNIEDIEDIDYIDDVDDVDYADDVDDIDNIDKNEKVNDIAVIDAECPPNPEFLDLSRIMDNPEIHYNCSVVIQKFRTLLNAIFIYI